MASQIMRITLKAYDHQLIDASAKSIIETVKKTGSKVSGPVPMPTKKEVVTILRAVHKYKDSREQFEQRTHKRLIDIITPTQKTVDALSRLEMPIYIVENGYGYDDQLVDGVINDDYRIDYMRKHIEEMKKAVEEGVDCRGYLSWGPIDILSSRAQMKKRYGFVYVNRDNDDLKDMRRIKKKSFEWYKNVISSNGEVL